LQTLNLQRALFNFQ